ncbi:MAG: hydantoinase/oxoprolinase family protein, partial [Rhodospirillaceae bacterium]|nr:hydantoinase/oxoprolinase family protein [Rhodospirillaceae bacterium]
CTTGFRDILELREGLKERRYDYIQPPPTPLVPRHLRLPIDERVNKDGMVLEPLAEDQVRAAAATFREQGVEAVAVCLLWSIVNPIHENRIKDILGQELPGVPVFLSARVSPQLREYPRFSTTALCAALADRLHDYIDRLEDNLADAGFRHALRYIQCNGGTTSAAGLRERPVLALDSGPAAGPAAGRFFGRLFDLDNIITLDMGGTSLDVSLVHDGRIDTAKNVDVHRYRVAVPMVNVRTLGAGGGSIARVDDSGLLQIGPTSAEAWPGPACYGRGGERATVTDANVALGYFSDTDLLGGAMAITGDLARNAIRDTIGGPLGVEGLEAAYAIYTLVNENMANAVRQISTEQGHDLRDFAFVCGGGCSAAHAARIAESLGVSRIIVPRVASLLCSFGAVITDVRHDYSRNHAAHFGQCDSAVINGHFDEMMAEARADLAGEGFAPEQIRLQRTMDVRYLGELGVLTLSMPEDETFADGMTATEALFDQAHERAFTFADPDCERELMGLGVIAYGERGEALSRISMPVVGDLDPVAAISQTRRASFAPGETSPIPVYAGGKMAFGSMIEGPAVIEEETTTILVPPGWHVRLDDSHAWFMWQPG